MAEKGSDLKDIKEIFRSPKMNIYSISLLGILMALSVVLNNVSTIRLTRDLRFSLAFVGTVIIAYYFGPLWTSGINGILNLLIFFIFSNGDQFFIGFTFSAILSGFIYGICFYPHKISMWRSIVAVLLVTVIVNFFLNSLWSSILYHKPLWLVFTQRGLKQVIMFVPQVVITYFILNSLSRLDVESKFS